MWVLSCVAGVLALAASARGPGLSPDSVTYLTSGLQLANGHGLTDVSGEPLTVFPPGMPLIVAAAEILGRDPQQALRWLSASCAVLAVVLTHVLVRRLPIRASVAWTMTALVAVSPALLGVTKMAWSEAPFVAVTLVTLIVLGDVWARRRLTPGAVVGLASLCWTAFLLRYAGVALILAVCLTLLCALRPRSVRTLTPVAACVGLAMTLPVLWMARNRSADGTLMGYRTASSDSPLAVAKRILATIGAWGAPFEVPRGLVVLGGMLVLAVATGVVAAVARRRRDPVEVARTAAGVGPSLVFVAVYITYLSTAQLSAAFDPIDNRLLIPAFAPLVVTAALAVDEAVVRVSKLGMTRNASTIIGAAVVAVVLLAQVGPAVRDIRRDAQDGIGYNARSWSESELAALAADAARTANSPLFTNETYGLWAATGHRPIFRLPVLASATTEADVDSELAQFATLIGRDGPVLIALYAVGEPGALRPEELHRVVDLERLATTGDGALYRATARPATR